MITRLEAPGISGWPAETRQRRGWHQAQLRRLLTSAFGRPLVENYFNTRDIVRIYIYGEYRAAAVITAGYSGIPYLDKFAVAPELQKGGIGSELWAAVSRDHPRWYWRSRQDRAINTWYRRQANGCQAAPPWLVYWRNLSVPEANECVRHALALPESFI